MWHSARRRGRGRGGAGSGRRQAEGQRHGDDGRADEELAISDMLGGLDAGGFAGGQGLGLCARGREDQAEKGDGRARHGARLGWRGRRA